MQSACEPVDRHSRAGTVACSGTEFCKLAITETKSFSRWLVEELEERLPGFDQHLKLHVTGCPNSCGQHWIADIGIEGKKIKANDRLVDAYYFCVGGALGLHQSTARPVGYRCAATEVPDALERLLGRYLDGRNRAKICAVSLLATTTIAIARVPRGRTRSRGRSRSATKSGACRRRNR